MRLCWKHDSMRNFTCFYTFKCLNVASIISSIAQLRLQDNKTTVFLIFIVVDYIIDVDAAFERSLGINRDIKG